jgi:hypothetical protein
MKHLHRHTTSGSTVPHVYFGASPCTSNHDSERLVPLVKAYALGDRLLAAPSRRAVNKTIVTDYTCAFHQTPEQHIITTIQYAYSNIPSNRVVLQWLANEFHKEWLEKWDSDNKVLEDLPKAFLIRVLRRGSLLGLAEMRTKKSKPCYLEHGSEKQERECGDLHMVFYEEFQYGYDDLGNTIMI